MPSVARTTTAAARVIFSSPDDDDEIKEHVILLCQVPSVYYKDATKKPDSRLTCYDRGESGMTV